MNPMQELSDNVAVPFEQARAMPPSVYTSTEFLEQELDKVFRQDWLCAGRSSSLPNPGDYTTMEIAGEPIMVLRDRDGSLRAQSNVCRHRMSTLLEGRGTVKSIVCPYHAWTYNLDGSLRGAPAMMHNTAFCKSEISLPTLRCEDWKGWIMVTLNPDATPVGEGLAEVDALVGHYGMENYVESFCETHRWNTNWKVLAENFMESYHLPVCHAGTIGGTVDLEKMTCPEGRPAFNYHWILKDNTMPLTLTLAHPNNTHLVGEDRNKTYLLSIYPALLITLTPGYFWYLSLQPDGPDHVNILFGGGLAPEFRDDPESATHFKALKTLLDEVNNEDRGCTEKVYRGLCAKSAEPGLLSHLERPNFDFARYLNAKIQGEG
ncbi:aromatic ring-hydroxylating oxygenase subunit alpha [Parasedimentitalea maritima]|nr:Rieske 2Fe-2S domain-containing protein [Zongyanglinia marina]